MSCTASRSMMRRPTLALAGSCAAYLWPTVVSAASHESVQSAWVPEFLGREAFGVAKTLALTLLLFFVGWVVAKMLAAGVLSLLRRTTVDDAVAERLGLAEDQAKAGKDGLERTIAGAVFWTVMLLVVVGVLQFAGLSQAAAPLENLVDSLGSAVPALLKAGLILALAYLVGRGLSVLAARAVGALGIERRLGAWSGDTAESERDLGALAGRVVFSVILLLGLGGALDALEIDPLSGPLSNLINTVVLALPTVLVAVVLVLVGWVVGKIARVAVRNLLSAVGFDGMVERIKLRPAFGETSPSDAVGWLVMAFVLLNASVAALDRVGLRTLADPVTAAMGQFWELLPGLAVSIGIVVVGLVFARVVRDLVTRALAGLGVDGLLARFGLEAVAERQDKLSRPSELLGWVAFVMIGLVALTQALANLELAAWSGYVDALLTFSMTRLLVALFVVAIGFAVGHRVRAIIASREFSGPKWVAELGRTAILVFAATMALNQLGVAEDFVLLAFGLLFGALCLALGLSFGLGGREVAGEIVRGRYDEMRRPGRETVRIPAAPAE